MGIHFSKKRPKINKILITPLKETLLLVPPENNHNFPQNSNKDENINKKPNSPKLPKIEKIDNFSLNQKEHISNEELPDRLPELSPSNMVK